MGRGKLEGEREKEKEKKRDRRKRRSEKLQLLSRIDEDRTVGFRRSKMQSSSTR